MIKRGSEHQRAQSLGSERDGEVCQICGSKGHTEGHHVFDYQFGGEASVDNIVTLCHECHQEVHKGKMDVFVF